MYLIKNGLFLLIEAYLVHYLTCKVLFLLLDSFFNLQAKFFKNHSSKDLGQWVVLQPKEKLAIS